MRWTCTPHSVSCCTCSTGTAHQLTGHGLQLGPPCLCNVSGWATKLAFSNLCASASSWHTSVVPGCETDSAQTHRKSYMPRQRTKHATVQAAPPGAAQLPHSAAHCIQVSALRDCDTSTTQNNAKPLQRTASPGTASLGTRPAAAAPNPYVVRAGSWRRDVCACHWYGTSPQQLMLGHHYK
jgi:hypothetical protein